MRFMMNNLKQVALGGRCPGSERQRMTRLPSPVQSLRWCIAITLTLTSVGCVSAPASEPADVDTSSAQLMLQIRAEIGNVACSNDAQCRTIGVGYKVCGGPAGYLAWSTQRSNEAKLMALVQREAELERIESERSGRLSDCRFVPDPGAVCRDSRCRLADGLGADSKAR